MSIWKLFGVGEPEQAARAEKKLGAGETETVRKIVQALDQLEPKRARFIAAFSYLLGRVAHADQHISEEETDAMERIVRERAHLPEEQAILTVHMAKVQNLLFGATENFLVTREFGKIASREEKSRCCMTSTRSARPTGRSRWSRTMKSGKSRGSCAWTIRTSSRCGSSTGIN